MTRSDRPTWDHQFAETESERNARLRAKRLTMNETNERNHTTQDEQPVTVTAERYRQYQDAETERDQLRADLREAVDALRPFTQTVTTAVNPRYDPAYVMTPFTYEDCAHAHAIVEKHKEPKP